MLHYTAFQYTVLRGSWAPRSGAGYDGTPQAGEPAGHRLGAGEGVLAAVGVTPQLGDRTPIGAPLPTHRTLVVVFGRRLGWVGGWRGDAVAFRFQSPPVEPCVRFSRTRLTDALHRRCSISPARPGWAWVRRRCR
jgi:hypothetical protein